MEDDFYSCHISSGSIKHGVLENGQFIVDFLLKHPFLVDCSFPCLITRGYIGNFIIPTDFYFFVGGVGIPPTTKRLNRNMSWE